MEVCFKETFDDFCTAFKLFHKYATKDLKSLKTLIDNILAHRGLCFLTQALKISIMQPGYNNLYDTLLCVEIISLILWRHVYINKVQIRTYLGQYTCNKKKSLYFITLVDKHYQSSQNIRKFQCRVQVI
jgi:hypothetical protein